MYNNTAPNWYSKLPKRSSTSPNWNMGVSKKSEHFRCWQHFLRYLVTHNYIIQP